MKFSIIVATYNRLPELQELFSSLEELTFDRSEFEVVISDDGSNDGTREYVNNQAHGFQIKYLHQSNQGPGPARNHAMEKASGTYFIFIDSDVLLPTDYLKFIDAFLQHNAVDAFGGPDDSHPSFSDFLKAVNYAMTSFLGTGGTRGATNSMTRFYPRSFNMGVHRKVFEQIGGMGALRHGQDMDYSMRIYNAGFEVALIPEAVVYHKRRTSLWRFFKQIFNWGVARINLGRKYPEMLRIVHLLPALILVGLVVLLILSIFYSWPQKVLLIAFSGALAVALLAFIQSFFRYRSLKVGLLSVLTLFTQVLAYGLGIWYAFFQVLQGKQTANGITRNYYK